MAASRVPIVTLCLRHKFESALFKANTIWSTQNFFSKGTMLESIYGLPISNHENVFIATNTQEDD
jgi:hypothetical protein